MSKLSEMSEWFRGKEPILEDHIGQRNTAMGATAARGFSRIPGLLIGGLTDLELKTKRALSALNYDIASRAIERELAQQGIDYDLAYKNAAIAREIEKATLLDSLTRELADSRKARDDRELVLEALAVEVGLRQVALINAKNAIEIEREQLQNQITAAQGQSMDKEVQLAQERLTTAQRKLSIIPHLQALVAAEEEVIAAETLNIDRMEDLINARLEQIPIKEDLIGLKDYLVTARDALTAPLLSVAEKKVVLAQARIDYETKAQSKITPANDLATAMTQLNEAMRVYINKRGELVDPYLERATRLSDLIEPTNEYAAELLETIPYIRELAEKRRELISPSMAKAEALRELISPMLSKAQKSLAYAQSLTDKVEIERAIKELSYQMEELRRAGIDADVEVMNKRLEEGDQQKALVAAELALRRLESSNRAALADFESSGTVRYLTAKEDAQSSVVAIEKEATTNQVDTGYEVAMIRMKAKYDSVKASVGARAGHDGSIEKIGRLNASERETTAEIAASAKITSSLIHQIK